ncbi:MAG: LysR family transcriptional regulator [Pseudomonadota bacterium]
MAKRKKTDVRRQRFVPQAVDPQKLQHFLGVYEHGNFGLAAAAGNVTQQAVSKAVAKLEHELGVPLFERTPHGAVPTIYAHTLARRAKIITSESRLAMAELSAMRGSTAGFVQVGIGWSFFPRIGPDAISHFRRQRPGVGLQVVGGTSAALYPRLARGELDLVVSAPPTELRPDPAIDTKVLYIEHDAVVLRAEHPLARKATVSLRDLSKCTWLVALSLPDRWHAICAAFANHGIEPPVDVIDLDSLSLAKSMLIRDDYACLLSEELVAPELKRGLYSAYRLDELPLNRPALLATRRGTKLQPAAKVLGDAFERICGEYYPA